jgi:hypothetical protein
VTTLYEGTSQIHKLIIGRGVTGINAMTPPEGAPQAKPRSDPINDGDG